MDSNGGGEGWYGDSPDLDAPGVPVSRGTGEGPKLWHLRGLKFVAEGPGFRPDSMSHVTPTEYREQAERFVAGLEADNAALTAEVERLRGVVELGRAVVASGVRMPSGELDTPEKQKAWLAFWPALTALTPPAADTEEG